MLCLERNQGERIIIYTPEGDKIVIQNNGVKRISLGFEADPKFKILREEVVGERIRKTGKKKRKNRFSI